MKSKILVTAVLFIITVTNSFAYHNYQNFPVTRDINLTTSFQKILVDKNVQLVLIQNLNKSSITIAGDEKDIKDVEANVVNGQLTITSKKKINNRVVVYVPVKDLSLVKLERGASVSGEGALKFDDLMIVINTNSKVNLKAVGNIIIKPADDCELVYEKNERSKIIY